MEAAGDREPWEASLDEAALDALTEIDGALLMELLDDKHGEEADDDRLAPVIRSLEAEISAAAAPAAAGSAAGCSSGDTMLESGHHHEDCEDCRLDDILSVPETHGCSTSSTYPVEDDPFGWVEMEAAGVGSPSSDLVDWYVDECISDQVGVVGYGEARCHSTSYYSEQYTSLWE
ncbi:hypothetical protein OPV22_031456 [Ensete ventricosum]|uniref:Uncharacterized protein n=1 Tax=Ensete ventricosum TaxID=4639 RepID=A0AAV8P0J1_ENSVE|nr:hypothetical protein OPV22_031456 [Ensete ventricosum]